MTVVHDEHEGEVDASSDPDTHDKDMITDGNKEAGAGATATMRQEPHVFVIAVPAPGGADTDSQQSLSSSQQLSRGSQVSLMPPDASDVSVGGGDDDVTQSSSSVSLPAHGCDEEVLWDKMDPAADSSSNKRSLPADLTGPSSHSSGKKAREDAEVELLSSASGSNSSTEPNAGIAMEDHVAAMQGVDGKDRESSSSSDPLPFAFESTDDEDTELEELEEEGEEAVEEDDVIVAGIDNGVEDQGDVPPVPPHQEGIAHDAQLANGNDQAEGNDVEDEESQEDDEDDDTDSDDENEDEDEAKDKGRVSPLNYYGDDEFESDDDFGGYVDHEDDEAWMKEHFKH